jgi:hypothetical protein
MTLCLHVSTYNNLIAKMLYGIMMKNINSIPILFLVTDDHCMTEGKNMPN